MFLSPHSFFHWQGDRTIVDIRPANAFVKGSFSGALSLPSEHFASCSDLIAALKNINEKRPVHLIDLDGTFAVQVLNDIDLYSLEGGYKSFRIWREWAFSLGPPIGVVGGKTGSGKTEQLQSLMKMGRQVIDLEQLAWHKGSVFGSLPGKQPTYERFQNNLLESWLSLDPDRPVWMEEKGPVLGNIGLPKTLYEKMLGALLVELDVSFEMRLLHIQKEYTTIDAKIFAAGIRKLEKRMGVSANHKALHYFASGQIEKCLQLLLTYYDRAYEKRREMYPSDRVLSVNPSVFENDAEVSSLEKAVRPACKKRDPAVYPRGTPLK